MSSIFTRNLPSIRCMIQVTGTAFRTHQSNQTEVVPVTDGSTVEKKLTEVV